MKYADLAELLELPSLPDHMSDVEDELVGTVRAGCDLLGEPAERMARGGGKRLRAVLVVAIARAINGVVDTNVLRAAATIELVHQGSLIHDDLLDRAVSRRGTPTVNAVEGHDRAVLVGDYVLAKAGQLSASISREVAQDVAVAIEALCMGQVLETDDFCNVDRTVERALQSVSGKTADLMLAACRVAAHCADADEQTLAAVGTYGHQFGMAFQLVDDVLDIVSTVDIMGKPVGNDIRSGVFTLPLLLTRDSRRVPGFHELMSKGTMDDAAAEVCLAAVRADTAVAATIDMARDYCDGARAALAPVLERLPLLRPLAELPSVYVDWALTELVPPRHPALTNQPSA
jgi:geranylgeranyl pyrophosphate synthase